MIHLQGEEHADTIGRLLEYIYKRIYTTDSDSSFADRCAQHARLYIAADKYLLPPLQATALTRYLGSLKRPNVDIQELIREVYVPSLDFPMITGPIVELLQTKMDTLIDDEAFKDCVDATAPKLWKDIVRVYAKSKPAVEQDDFVPTCTKALCMNSSARTLSKDGQLSCVKCGEMIGKDTRRRICQRPGCMTSFGSGACSLYGHHWFCTRCSNMVL